MGWFGSKKEDGKGAGGPQAGPQGNGIAAGEPVKRKFIVEPDKAARFFAHARTVHETTNFEYAMQSWLQGLRFDPTNMSGLEGYFSSAAKFEGSPGKDTLKLFSGKDDVEKYLLSLMQWSFRPLDASQALKAAESASALGLEEPTHWIAVRAAGAAQREKKPRKDHFVRLMNVFSQLHDFDKAVEMGEIAKQLDPTDGQLAALVRNLSASATMSRGGYEQTGQTGGFRANVKDLEKQRQLEDAERVVKSEETTDRLVRASEEEYKQKPDDPAIVDRLITRLLERGTDDDEKRAYRVALKAFETTKQFRFRQRAGDVKLRRAQRMVVGLRDAAAAKAGDEAAAEAYRKGQEDLRKMEIEEYRLRVDAYPTDLVSKFELGKRLFEAGQFDESIPLFQDAQGDAKRRFEALNLLGQSFLRVDFADGAIHAFRQAIEQYKTLDDDMGMDLRYGLLVSLQTKAEAERSLAEAEEADKLASAIAVHKFNYKDVRARRDALKKLLGELKRGSA